jgi:hypothetical protein
MRKETYTCDICEKKVENHVEKDIQVIFLTEQNEGRTIKPYMDNVKIDICDACMEKRMGGGSIYATGTMGHNDYHFAKPR